MEYVYYIPEKDVLVVVNGTFGPDCDTFIYHYTDKIEIYAVEYIGEL